MKSYSYFYISVRQMKYLIIPLQGIKELVSKVTFSTNLEFHKVEGNCGSSKGRAVN